MASRLWRGIDKDQAQRRADEERRLAAQAADWLKLRSSFVERLSELRAPQTINFRDYRLRECFSPQVHAWWPAERAEEIEARLLAADARGDVRLGHLHGGTPESNPALDTLRMLDRAEKAGDEAKRAMLVLALLEYRCIDNHPAIPSDLRWRANAACRWSGGQARWGCRRAAPASARLFSQRAACMTVPGARLISGAPNAATAAST